MKRTEQSPLRRFFSSRLFLVIALTIAVLTALGFARAYYQDYKVRQEINNLNDEVKKLEKKKIESMEILKYVGSQNFVEDKARTELNLKKPGEHVLIINDPGQAVTSEPAVTSSTPELLNNPHKWWYYFVRHSL